MDVGLRAAAAAAKNCLPSLFCDSVSYFYPAETLFNAINCRSQDRVSDFNYLVQVVCSGFYAEKKCCAFQSKQYSMRELNIQTTAVVAVAADTNHSVSYIERLCLLEMAYYYWPTEGIKLKNGFCLTLVESMLISLPVRIHNIKRTMNIWEYANLEMLCRRSVCNTFE